MTLRDRTYAPFSRVELRDLGKVEAAARETLRQCEFLRKNGEGDRIRFGLIAVKAWEAWRAAARADRRAAAENDWTQLHWRLPKGYDALSSPLSPVPPKEEK